VDSVGGCDSRPPRERHGKPAGVRKKERLDMIRFMMYGKHGTYLGTGIVATWKEWEDTKKALESNGQKATITEVKMAEVAK